MSISRLEREFREATIKITARLPLKHCIEVYQRPDGDIQCIWTPDAPDLKNRHIRKKVVPAYEKVMAEFLEVNSAAIRSYKAAL